MAWCRTKLKSWINKESPCFTSLLKCELESTKGKSPAKKPIVLHTDVKQDTSNTERHVCERASARSVDATSGRNQVCCGFYCNNLLFFFQCISFRNLVMWRLLSWIFLTASLHQVSFLVIILIRIFFTIDESKNICM